MNDEARFVRILEELGALRVSLTMTGVPVTLVGGQVLAVESMTRGGSGLIEVRTETGVVLERGFSMEPDLLFDVEEAGARSEAILDVFRQRGFSRVRSFRWGKYLPEAGTMLVDLFVPEGTDPAFNPGGFTELPAAELVLARPRSVELRLGASSLEIEVPDPVGFLATKLEAKRRLRPNEIKDSFDLFAYVALVGPDEVAAALRERPDVRTDVLTQLDASFGDVEAPGVADVLRYAATLSEPERALLARAVVDLFERVQ